MKKVIVLAALALGALSFANAQSIKPASDSKKGEVRPAKSERSVAPAKKSESAKIQRQNAKTSEMDKVVGLDDNQRNKIASINKEQNAKMKEVRMKYAEKTGEEKKQMNVEIKELQKERKSRVQNVLTTEQQEKWKAHKKAKKEATREVKKVEPKSTSTRSAK